MTPTEYPVKAALKLLEAFSWRETYERPFERYWRLKGPVNAFSEVAKGPVEQQLAKALLEALDTLLRSTARDSFHLDAQAVADYLGAAAKAPYQRRRYPRRRR